MTFDCYSQRMLNPFRGIVSCVRYKSADAVTADGKHWDIYVSNEALLDEMPEGYKPQVSDIRYGSWSEQQGLKRGPLLPSDDFLQLESLGTRVYEHLTGVYRDVPFPLLDVVELWLLDTAGRPLALLDSALDAGDIDAGQAPGWRPGLDCRRTFTSSVAGQLLDPHYSQGDVTDYLAAYINALAGPTPAAQVFRRNAGGSGSGLWGINLPAGLEQRELENSAFPPQLLDRDRHDELHTRLVDDFIRWQAPWQLLLPGMDAAERGELELHARVQPLKVARQYRLYPDIIDRAVIDAARVEARLRKTVQQRKPSEKIMSTFYIELSQETADE